MAQFTLPDDWTVGLERGSSTSGVVDAKKGDLFAQLTAPPPRTDHSVSINSLFKSRGGAGVGAGGGGARDIAGKQRSNNNKDNASSSQSSGKINKTRAV